MHKMSIFISNDYYIGHQWTSLIQETSEALFDVAPCRHEETAAMRSQSKMMVRGRHGIQPNNDSLALHQGRGDRETAREGPPTSA
jgi:hypothetical protein